jgi:leucine dehydrogenase
MSVFSAPDYDDHEVVEFVRDTDSGLSAIIAIHSTARGPALGGCRMFPYASEADAIADVLRLSRGMSYKAAMADVALGGGKSIIMGDAATQKTEAMLLAMGRAIDQLQGRYITGEDIGTRPADMAVIRRETRSVSCLEEEHGGYGDPAILTALGVFQSILAGCQAAFETSDVAGMSVAVQGVGNVGQHLCRMLAEAGASLFVCDPVQDHLRAISDLNPTVVALDDIYAAEAQVFAPCAIGGTLNDDTIPLLKGRVVAGAANNQLYRAHHADALAEREIIYLPDYVANGGGLISCEAEWFGTDKSAIKPRVLKIFDTCLDVIKFAKAKNTNTGNAADQLAVKKILAAKQASKTIQA